MDQDFELPFKVTDALGWLGLLARAPNKRCNHEPFSVQWTIRLGLLRRVVYIPPSDVFPPEGRWAAMTYEVQDKIGNIIIKDGSDNLEAGHVVQEPQSGNKSQPGQVSFSSVKLGVKHFIYIFQLWCWRAHAYSKGAFVGLILK